MDRETFNVLRKLAYDLAGITLNDGKQALVAGRVAKRLRILGLSDEREYAKVLTSGKADAELVHFLDVISTNFTSFFREIDHFELLRDFVTEQATEGQREFKFWSAACSTGEEIYSMAICLSDTFATWRNVSWRILGTDISTQVLQHAKQGVYSETHLRPVSSEQRRKYFTAEKSDEKLFRIKPELRSKLAFSRMNLATPPFPMKGPFDMIFCRNVMIYFDREVRFRLVSEIERLLKPGGFLVVGHTETLTGCRCGLKTISPSVYIKPK